MPDRSRAARASGARARPPQVRHMVASAVAGVLAVALLIGALMWLISVPEVPVPSAHSADVRQPAAERDIATTDDEPGSTTSGPVESSTHTTVTGAPQDPTPYQATDGSIVHPRQSIGVYDRPGGQRIARIGPTQIGDTWLPVIAESTGWVQVLLPSRPNGSTGWLEKTHLDEAYSPYLIEVQLASMRLRLYFEGREVESWPIGIGKPSTPTPTGRTFLLGSFVDPDQQYSPIILPLGAHSDTLDSFGGGPGTVAIHTWPTTDVIGKATSHGCIRVPKDALNRLTDVPLGTLVLVDKQ